jgi:hypothetical protein
VSIPTFSSYQPPGVYVEAINTPLVTPTGVPAQTLCIVGPAVGYRTATQSFLIYASTPFSLSFTGVFTTAQAGPPAISAPVVINTASRAVLTAGVDYSLNVVPDPSGNPALAVTQVERVNTSPNITDGTEVTITYNYADVTYYQPQIFTDPQSVVNAYGPPFAATVPTVVGATQIANALSFAASVAFTNGANTLVCVALNPSSGTLEQQYQAAYASVQTIAGITLIVPVWTDDLTVPGGSNTSAFALQLAEDLDTACDQAANSGFPRIGIFGLPRLYSESTISVPTFTSTINDERLIVLYPEIDQVYNPLTSQYFNVSGWVSAIAAGAALSALPVNTGLTQNQLKGFNLTQAELATMTQSFMNTLAASGACIVYQDYNGVLRVRHGLTTQMGALNTREISLVRQGDTLLVLCQQGLVASLLIGKPITPSTPALVQAALTGILQQAFLNNIIQGYQNITVIQQAYPGGDPTIVNCTFQYSPAVPLNYLTVAFSINLNTGQLTPQSTQNAAATG